MRNKKGRREPPALKKVIFAVLTNIYAVIPGSIRQNRRIDDLATGTALPGVKSAHKVIVLF